MTPVAPGGRKVAVLGIAIASIGVAAAGLMLQPASGARPEPQFVTAPPRALTPTAVKPASELSDAFIAVSEAVTPAVVRIEAEHTEGSNRDSWFSRSLPQFFAKGDTAPPTLEVSGGSGFIVSANGYILTNYHVVENAQRITVALADKRVFHAELIGADPSTDIAVIRIDAENLPAVALGDSDLTRVGEWVLAIGNPGFDKSPLDFTVTSGIISAKGRPLDVLDPDARGYAIEDFIQTDAVINPGNSGGPLVDIHGRVIGINTAIATSTGYNQGYGFAIPMNLVQRVMRDLIEHGYVRRALLGVKIAEVTPEDAEVYGLSRIAGVVVEDYDQNSPATAAGLRRADVIVAVDGTAVESVNQLQRLIAVHDPGETVSLSIVRFGSRLVVPVQLAQADGAAVKGPGPPVTMPDGLGIELEDLEAEGPRGIGTRKPAGVYVSNVVPGSAADRKDIQPGLRVISVNQRAVSNAREARRSIDAVRPGGIVSLLLEDAEGTFIANVRIPT
jgi:serine protease Do